MSHEYFHGFSTDEQQRLIQQAHHWRHSLIPVDLSWQPDDQVLEVGCGVGAVLAVLHDTFPGIHVTGVDIEPAQIRAAQQYLTSLDINADLRVADGGNLPYDDDRFDHVYMHWLLEHVPDVKPILREALRVLRPGGTITLTETDYTTFKVTPPSADWNYLEEAQYQFFAKHGHPIAGRQLGVWLAENGFVEATNRMVGFHFFQGRPGLREHVDYVLGFLAPGIATLTNLGYDEDRLHRGLEWLGRVPDLPGGTFTHVVYRAQGRKPK